MVELGPSTRMLVGRALDLSAGEIDVANAVVHREGDELFVVDTGATADFRAALVSLCRDLAPSTPVAILTTHAHADHVSNNTLLDDLDVASKRHFVSGPDLATLHDNNAYFARGLCRCSRAWSTRRPTLRPRRRGSWTWWARSTR
ncbi:MAG: MBL fold metallo-hydrolase [Acidimicrobiia bacterium]|nr:MBL fold metallo-hydrolase [Acidimicrobiia bacterium]